MEVSDLCRVTICHVTAVVGQLFLLHPQSEGVNAFFKYPPAHIKGPTREILPAQIIVKIAKEILSLSGITQITVCMRKTDSKC